MSNTYWICKKLLVKYSWQALNLFHVDFLMSGRFWVISMSHTTIVTGLIVTGSDVIIDDVTRCWDYRRERPNFSRSVRSISLNKQSCQSHKANVMEFYVTLPDSFNFKWPWMTSLASLDVSWNMKVSREERIIL